MKLRHLLLLFISFFFVLPLYAEYFKHIGLSEGLTQPSVWLFIRIGWAECGLEQRKE